MKRERFSMIKSFFLMITLLLINFLILSPQSLCADDWTKIDLGEYSSYSLAHIGGTSSNNVFLGAGWDGILKYDGTSLSPMTLPDSVTYPEGISGDLAITPNLVMQGGEGSTWNKLNITTEGVLAYRDVSISPSGGLAVIVGHNGHELRREGGTWTSHWYSASRFLSVYVADNTHYYRVSGTGILNFKYYDSEQMAWQSGYGLGGYTDAGIIVSYVWGNPSGSSPGEIYTVGRNTIGHFDGSNWTLMDHPISWNSSFYFAGIVNHGGTLYAYGGTSYSGKIFKLSSGTWVDISPNYMNPVRDMKSIGGDLFAVGPQEFWVLIPPPDYQFSADYIQTIQDPGKVAGDTNSTETYVIGKPVYIRAYVTCADCTNGELVSANVTLTVETPDTFYTRTYTKNLTINTSDTPDTLRDKPDQSFNILVPRFLFKRQTAQELLQTTTSRTITLDLEVTDSSGTIITRQLNKTISSEYIEPLEVGVIPIIVVNGTDEFMVDEKLMHNQMLFMELVFPGQIAFYILEPITFDLGAMGAPPADEKALNEYKTNVGKKVIAELAKLHTVNAKSGVFGFDVDYIYGVWPYEALTVGGVSDPYWNPDSISGYVAMGEDSHTGVDMMAHELGHNLGLQHPAWIQKTVEINGESYVLLKGTCNPADVNIEPPPDDLMIMYRETTSFYTWNYNDAYTHVYGYEPTVFGETAIGKKYYDFMSYCGERFNITESGLFIDPNLWISDLHYAKLIDQLKESPRPHKASMDLPRKKLGRVKDSDEIFLMPQGIPTPHSVVTAKINTDDTVNELTMYDFIANATLPRSSETATDTNYCVQTQDGSGVIIDTQCFTLDFRNEDHKNVTSAWIQANMNYSADTQSVVIKKGETVLATLSKTANNPAVSNITISDISSGSGDGVDVPTSTRKRICWDATDADVSDTMTYTVQYSADGGTTWQTLVIDWADTCYTVDISYLPASTTGKLRVIASDGFNQSDPTEAPETVQITDSGPSIVLGHGETLYLVSGSEFRLSATAYDFEDGPIGAANIVWKDKTGTVISTDGHALVTKSQGTQTYTVTATDSADNSNSITVILNTQVPFAEGDVNGDENINLGDAILALKVSASIEPSSVIYTEADVNNDDRIGLEEAIYVLQAVSRVRMLFSIQSSAFTASNPIPLNYTCDSGDVSPPLSWDNAPAGTQSLVLIMDDPDAPGGTWDHWIVYDIPASITSISENTGVSGGGNLPSGAIHGTNSWNNTYYQGPCPPSGTHRYFFKLYSLSVSQLNPSGTSKAEIEAAMAGNILSKTELIGTYTFTP